MLKTFGANPDVHIATHVAKGLTKKKVQVSTTFKLFLIYVSSFNEILSTNLF